MANKYTDILALVNKGNQMGLSNTIKRDYGIPLDFTSVQQNYDEAVKYAATSTLAYVGQPIAVGDKLYIVTETAAAKHTVGEGETAVEYDVFLAEVGSATEGDGASITLKDGKLSITGFELADGATLPQKQADGSLKWVGIDAIVEGDGNTKTVVATTEGSPISITKTYDEESDTYTYTLGITLPDVYTKEEADELFLTKTGAEGIYLKTTDFNSAKLEIDGALGERYTKTDADATFAKKGEDAYDDTELTERVSTLETGIQNVYTKSETYSKDEVNSALANITHFTTKVVASTDEMDDPMVLYLVADIEATGADKYYEYLVINGIPTIIGDTTTNLSQYATKEELNNHATTAEQTYATKQALEIHASEAAGLYATKDELSEHEETAATTYATKTELASKVDTTKLTDYYTKEEVENKGYAVAETVESQLAGKADVATTLAGYGITDAYTKSETVAKTDVYTKAEVNDLLDGISGGSSETAASVKRALDGYIQSMDTEVYGAEVVAGWTAEDGTYIPTYAATNSRIDKVEAAAAGAQTAADNAASLATSAQTAVDDLAAGQVKTNKEDIDIVKGRLDTLETAKGNHETRLSTAEGKITALEGQDETINKTLNTVQGEISTLKSKDAELLGLIEAQEEALGDKADKTALETLEGKVYTKTEVDNLLTSLDLTTVKADVEANKTAIADEVTRAKSAEQANADAISALIGIDTDKTIREIAAEETAKVVDSAPEAFDTLKEIAVWIENDETGAAAISSAIAAHSTILAGFGGEDEPADVVSFVNSSIAAAAYQLPVATVEALGGIKAAAATLDNGVQVSAEGVATVGRVNVNTLVQTEGDTFILNGGKA